MSRYKFEPGVRVLYLSGSDVIETTIERFGSDHPENGQGYLVTVGEGEDSDLIEAYANQLLPQLDLERDKTKPAGIVRYTFRDDKGQQCSLEFNRHKDTGALWLGIEINLQGVKLVAGRMCINRAQAMVIAPLLQEFATKGTVS